MLVWHPPCQSALPDHMRMVASYPEELGEGSRDGSKVGVDLDQAPQPAGQLLAGSWGLEALITHDDGAVVAPVPDHSPHGLVHCSATPQHSHDACLTSNRC
jgi:hypothetical protein